MDRILLHSDMNNFFASVECVYNEKLKAVPMVVCGDPETRHGIVLAKNPLAKNLGVITGESVYSAKQKIPSLTIVNADYSRYVKYAKLARKLYSEYSNNVIPYGLDEAWLDLTNNVKSINEAKTTADEIRLRIKSELKLTCSIGVSYNYVFSKLASDMKKPDATTVLSKDDYETIICNIPAFEMLFVGPATRKKLMKMNILTIGDLANCDVRQLQKVLGKNGSNLWQMANGDDSSFNPEVPENEPFKSIGNTITVPKDLTDETDILSLLYILTRTVCARLKKHSLKAKCISINFKYNDFKNVIRQITIHAPTNNETTVYMYVKKLFENNFNKTTPVRSLGVHVSGLFNDEFTQLSLFDEKCEPTPEINEIIRNLKNKLGNFNLEKSSMGEEQIFDINELI